MLNDSAHAKTRAQTMKTWLAAADLILAACSVLVAVAWTWKGRGEGIVIMVTLLMLLAATAFVLAHLALKRDWAGQWLLQTVGPAMVILLLFGLSWAVVSFVAAVLVGWLALRKEHSRSNAA